MHRHQRFQRAGAASPESVREIPRVRRRRRIAAAARRLTGGGAGLHRCIVCGSDCVDPIAWDADGPEHWVIQLHCGECDIWRDARATNAEANAFDLELDRQLAQMERAIARIDRDRMRDAVVAFTAALDRDLIDPADFSR